MAPNARNSFHQERDQTLGRILSAIEARQESIPTPLITDLKALSPGAERLAAEHTTWSLLADGIRHLKSGAPEGQPGTMSAALTKTSLRSAALAASMGIKPPQFENILLDVDYSRGHDAALFLCRHLIEAALTDLPQSVAVMQQKIYLGQPPVLRTEDMPDIEKDPALKEIFENLRAAHDDGITLPGLPGRVTDETQALRRQAILTLNTLAEVYDDTCHKMTQMLAEDFPPPPPAKRKNKNFDL